LYIIRKSDLGIKTCSVNAALVTLSLDDGSDEEALSDQNID